MESATNPPSPRKKLKSPFPDAAVNPKTSITCSNVPDSLFDPATVKKHFSKFGRVLKIKLYAKRHMCIIEYDHPNSAERALLNAGAFDGFMFDVTRSKPRVRRRSSRKDDDPDWVPDSDVEEELSAMGSTPTYRVTRQNTMDIQSTSAPVQSPRMKVVQRTIKQSPIKKRVPVKEKPFVVKQSVASILEPPVTVTTIQTNLSTSEAASELYQLCSKISQTSDEKWRVLDARDKILRAWGGAGSRIKVGGATIGTCQDMCPEKELLQRQAEHQVMTLETVVESDGELEPWRAVKQYSRSSADQDIPMCYELRPARVLLRTIAYLLHEIADTPRQVSMADWFHFMWDRLRGIRKDITQQALCCADSIYLVEMCARFHAHCAARLADLEHTQFDQKLNTDNLTKCLQTLKHMYADVGANEKPREAEFRGYVALLNLGDANFWWEIQQLPEVIQKSEPILFAIKAFNAIDNNNYVRFFRLVRQEATYLQACILLRYFNDVRARALARIVKAYAPRGGSRYPASDMIRILAFESVENLKSFINHYGLRFARTDDSELSLILDRNQFIEDSDPYPIARAIKLIESKRNCTVGEIIAGGTLPDTGYQQHIMYTSFASDGRLKESALVAEDQDYNTTNDSNKDVKALKSEILRLTQGSKTAATEKAEPNLNAFAKVDTKSSPNALHKFVVPVNTSGDTKLFSFKPAIPVAPTEVIKNSPEKIFSGDKSIFSFSKPQETENIFVGSEAVKSIFDSQTLSNKNNIFSNPSIDVDRNTQSIFESTKPKDNIFKNISDEKLTFTKTLENKSANLFGVVSRSIFSANENKANNQSPFASKNIFAIKPDPVIENKSLFGGTNLFTAKENKNTESQTLGAKNVFASATIDPFVKSDNTVFVKSGNLFEKPAESKEPSSIFGAFGKLPENNSLFTKPDTDKAQTLFSNGKGPNPVSPSTLFKSILNGADSKNYSIFQSKNKAQTVADNILNSVTAINSSSVYDFNQNDYEEQNMLAVKKLQEQKQGEERILLEKNKKEEDKRKEELRRQEEEKFKEEARKKQAELKLLEEKRKKEEEMKKEELKKKMEQEKKQLEQAKAAELKRKAEDDRLFKEQIDKESVDLIEELINEVNHQTLKGILKEELDSFNSLMDLADTTIDDIISDICGDVCESEMKAEQFLTRKIMKKWFHVWRGKYIKNIERRNILDDTPVWLTRFTPEEEAVLLKRIVENAALRNMNAIHRGYRFSGELKQLPTPEPYNVMEIIRSPLLKRMNQICYPYDKCFFWKLTLILPHSTKWLYRRIDVEKWLLNVFSDGKKHESDNLIRVEKQSWNHLMDFAISVGITSKDQNCTGNEVIDGANALLFYATECDNDLVNVIETTLKYKYPYQIVPVAVIIPHTENEFLQSHVEILLADLVKKNVILAYRVFVIGAQTVFESLHVTTKTAMKWLAKKYPKMPPLDIDHLKSICQRYLGNEIWCMLRSNIDGRMNVVIKDLLKLVKCYNIAVEKLTEVITNEDLFNYPSFPLEFQSYLDSTSPYPKPFEFIPSNVKTSDNISAIKRIMNQLKMPDPSLHFNPVNAITMKEQITSYCNQIGWFQNPEEIVCKVVAVLPTELSNTNIRCEDFRQYYAHYNLLDFMNIIVYEKINTLKNFENRFAVYEKSVLENYRNGHWLHEINVIRELKHKVLEYEDEIDFAIEAKRRKLAMGSLECLMLEDKDTTLVEEQIKEKDLSICKYNNCTEAVKQLENMLDEEKIKSIQFENLLKAALEGH